MATRKKAEAETVETVATTEVATTEVAAETVQEAIAETAEQGAPKVEAALNDPRDAAFIELQTARCSAGKLYYEKAKELVELDIEARKAGLEKCLKLFQTISDTPSNDIQIRQIEQATQLYKALTNGPCY